ncbi:MAG: response regulator [Deltaproteobacteria bacterium]|nr:response regulator [Deltaproteobacteria bacterium]
MKSALIVEPDAQGRLALASLLHDLGFHVHGVGSAEDAATMLAQLRFHVVITEMALPLMSGLVLVESIRASPTTQTMPIIVASAHCTAEVKRLARAAGCSKFVDKPIDVATFGAQVLELVGARSRSPSVVDPRIR